jgi:hypothetical protein
LTQAAKEEIDSAIKEIRELQYDHNYSRIFFSCDEEIGQERPKIGTAIFRIGDDVRDYITEQIYSLGEYPE